VLPFSLQSAVRIVTTLRSHSRLYASITFPIGCPPGIFPPFPILPVSLSNGFAIFPGSLLSFTIFPHCFFSASLTPSWPLRLGWPSHSPVVRLGSPFGAGFPQVSVLFETSLQTSVVIITPVFLPQFRPSFCDEVSFSHIPSLIGNLSNFFFLPDVILVLNEGWEISRNRDLYGATRDKF